MASSKQAPSRSACVLQLKPELSLLCFLSSSGKGIIHDHETELDGETLGKPESPNHSSDHYLEVVALDEGRHSEGKSIELGGVDV